MSYRSQIAGWAARRPDRARGGIARRLLNVRDLGGLPTAAGPTENGVLFRSDAPYAADRIAGQFSAWPPSDVVDLRSIGEARTEYTWPSETSVHHLPLMADAAPGLHHGSLEAIYLAILESVGNWAAEFMSIVANAEGPTLVHCAVGKDRTGVAIAVLLLAGGVEEAAVVADYQATRPQVEEILDRIRVCGYDLPREFPSHLKETPADAIGAVTQILRQWPGGAVGWLVDHGADPADVSRWPSRFVGGAEHGRTQSKRLGLAR